MSTPRNPSRAMTFSAASCGSSGKLKSAQLKFRFIASIVLKGGRAGLARFPVERVQLFQHRPRVPLIAKRFLQRAAAVGLQRHVTAVTRADQGFFLRRPRTAEKS